MYAPCPEEFNTSYVALSYVAVSPSADNSTPGSSHDTRTVSSYGMNVVSVESSGFTEFIVIEISVSPLYGPVRLSRMKKPAGTTEV